MATTYSVWNQALGAFDYYESNKNQAQLNVEKPSHIGSRTLGATVDQAAWPMPADARKIGSGATPIGKVSTLRKIGGLGSMSDALGEATIGKAVLAGGVAYLAWKYVAKRRKR